MGIILEKIYNYFLHTLHGCCILGILSILIYSHDIQLSVGEEIKVKSIFYMHKTSMTKIRFFVTKRKKKYKQLK